MKKQIPRVNPIDHRTVKIRPTNIVNLQKKV